MKKIILLFIFIFSITAINAQQQKQEPQQPTSEEEYNFGFTGYKLQLQMKLPMKKGYTMTDLATVERGERKCVFKNLMRDKEKQPCAVIMIYDRPRVNPEYFCIPSSDAPAELWDKFASSLKSDVENEQERYKFFTYAIATAMMKK